MNVGELIQELNKLNPKARVILAKDSEGNEHKPLADFWTGSYSAYNDYSGEVGLEKLTEEDLEQGYTEEDIVHGEPAVILVP